MDDGSNEDQGDMPSLAEVFRPWEQRGESRRDCRRHRGGLLLFLARIALLAGGLSLVCPPFGLLGLAMGLATCVLARHDLDLIFAGEMEQQGYKPTEKARSDGHAATIVSALGVILWLVVVASICGILAMRAE
jgi:hypothetical protein